MNIGFDISQTGKHKAGCGYFAHSMIEHLVSATTDLTFKLYSNFGTDFFDPEVGNLKRYSGENVIYGDVLTRKADVDKFWQSEEFEKDLGLPNIIHSNNFWCPGHHVNAKFVYTLYDLSFFQFPDWTTEQNRAICARGVLNAAVFADRLLAISEYTKTSFLEFFPYFPDHKIDVIYPGSRFEGQHQEGNKPKFLRSHNLDEFWLCVGTIEPRKNQKMLIEAYCRYSQQVETAIPLILVGGNGWLMDDFDAFIKSKNLGSRVILAGYVTDEELIWLYRNCRANFYPSHFEGFGLPVLEGMGLGAASICSDTSSLPEVIGEAGIVIDPGSVNEWAETFCRLSVDSELLIEMRHKSLKQAKKFNWDTSANRLIDVYTQKLPGKD